MKAGATLEHVDVCAGRHVGHYFRRDAAGVWRCQGCPEARVLLRYGVVDPCEQWT